MLRLVTAGIVIALLSDCPEGISAHGTSISTAQALIEKEQFRAALRVLDDVSENDSAGIQALYLRGYVLYRLRELENSRAQFEEVTRIAPPALRSRYFLGRIAMLQGHPEQAAAWLEPVARETPPIEDSAAQLGKAYLDAHRLREAREWTEKALKIAPWDGSLHYRLARIYQQLGNVELAAIEFQASASSHSADQAAVQELIHCSQDLSRGDLESARQRKESLLKKPQLDPDVLVALGSSFATNGFQDEALTLFKEAVRRDPGLFQAQFDVGLASLKLGHATDSIVPLQECLRIAPNSVDANAALALAYVMLGDFKEALSPLELVHALQPENTKTKGLLALSYLRTGTPQKALAILRKAIEEQKSDPKLYFLLIECLNSLNDEPAALSIADDAALRFPKLAKAHLARAQQFARLGRYRDARPSFEKAVELSPQDTDALLGLAEVQNKSGNYADSLATYQRTLELDHTSLTAELGSAKDLIALGKLSEAKQVLEQALFAHAENVQVHSELARLYGRLGDRDRAAKEAEISQELKSHKPDTQQ